MLTVNALMIKWHIFLSTITLIVMIAAGVQALLLILQDYYLRHHPVNFLPSLQTLEKYLFRTILLGWFLLVAVFIDGLLSFGFSAVFAKVFLTFIALLIFSFLLWGRYRFGWRGKVAVRWTFFGLSVLLVIYCGTGLLLHVSY